MGSLSDGIDNLCLDDDVSSITLGAIPKVISVTTQKPSPLADQATPQTPPTAKKQQRKKNRKDRRRSDHDSGGDSAGPKPPQQMSKVEKLRVAGGSGVQRSNSERKVDPGPLSPDVSSLLFKSNTSISVNTGIKNLPDSFFSDRLPEEIEEDEIREKSEKDQKKRKRKKQKRKQTSTEEEDEKQVSEKENTEEDILNDKLIDDDPGEEIITHYGDEQCVYNWRNVTRNGDIKKCILVEGAKEGGRPKNGDVVLVKSQGKLKDGAMIDDYPTLVFRVGEYEVIEGLDLVVQSMYKNELAIVSIKPSLAYGSQGRKPDIPPDSRITYLFGLLHFEKQKDITEITWAQRRKMGQSRMRIANWWYSRKEYSISVKCYKKALQYYNNIPTNQECSTAEEYKELLALMEERLRVMRQVANIFKRIANLIQSGTVDT